MRVLGQACNNDDRRRQHTKATDDDMDPTATAVLLPMVPAFLSCTLDSIREVRLAAVQVLGTLDLHLHPKECAQCTSQLQRLVQSDTSVVVRSGAEEVIKRWQACITDATAGKSNGAGSSVAIPEGSGQAGNPKKRKGMG
jgi:hypothetical protein